tara:strand:+ start:34942 stop:35052 length:111 start_codon:yes stop_codon:yes gene_type:complete
MGHIAAGWQTRSGEILFVLAHHRQSDILTLQLFAFD